MATSLVDNLRPISRVQSRPVDIVLRATESAALRTYRGNQTMLQWEMSAFASFTVQLVGDSNQFAIEGSNDLISWAAVDYWTIGRNAAPVGLGGATAQQAAGLAFFQENSPMLLGGNQQSRFVRIRLAQGSGSRMAAAQVLLSQNPLTPPRQTLLGPDDTWSYVAPSGGIVNTTPVTIKAALNGTHRHVINRLQLANGGGTGTEVILTDAVTPTILWRGYLAAGATANHEFNPPLRAAPNSALTITLSAASGAAVYVNAQGLTGLA